MLDDRIEVIATTISGSIRDWGKVERIVPLFRRLGREEVSLSAADSHARARELTRQRIAEGARTLISAGGSGTFNAVLEGCIDSGVPLTQLTLGFLRKGSADLIGKTLGMPDEIVRAVEVFVDALDRRRTVPCDVIEAAGGDPTNPPRHFVGYGGAEIFGRIPHYTENRFIKYYKGVLSQLFGDLGPFFVGAVLASSEKVLRRPWRGRRIWEIRVDGLAAARGAYQAMILVNGDLGPDLPFARAVPLGSGDFHLFALRDLGLRKLPGQFRKAWTSTVMEHPRRYGFEHYRVTERLELVPAVEHPFPVNVDGSTLICAQRATFRIVDQIRLISGRGARAAGRPLPQAES